MCHQDFPDESFIISTHSHRLFDPLPSMKRKQNKGNMKNLKNLNELFLDQLADIYHAERQLVKALPKMAKATSSPELKSAIESHLTETEGHVQRLERVFEAFDRPAKGKKCQAMEGLIEEAKEMMDEEAVSSVMDAA